MGVTHLEYRQVYNGVPVFAAVLRAHVDAQDNLTPVNGVFIPDLSVNTQPNLTDDQAADRAVGEVVANPPENDKDQSTVYAPGDLLIESKA